MALKKYSPKRVLLPFALIGSDEEEVLVCLKREEVKALQEYVRPMMAWESTWVKAYTPGGYETPDEAEMEIAFEWCDQLLAKLVEETMTTCGEFTEALDGIATVLKQYLPSASGGGVNCGCGSGGAGGVAEEFSPVVDDGVNAPPGFPDRGTYEAYKCTKSKEILDSVIADLTVMTTWDLAAALAGAGISGAAGILATILLTPHPFDDLLAIVVALAAGVAVAVSAATVVQCIIDTLTAEYASLVCFMVEASDASDAASAVRGHVANNLTCTGLVASLAGNLVNPVISNSSFNELFTSYDGEDFSGVINDCGCGCPDFVAAWGVDNGDGTITAESDGTHWRVAIMVTATDYQFDGIYHCGTKQEITYSGDTPGSPHPTDGWRAYDNDGTILYQSSSVPWPSNQCARAYYWKRTEQYTIDISNFTSC